MLRLLGCVCLIALASCCSYPSHARIRAGGQQLCARHHVPLLTARGFTYSGKAVILIHHRPSREFERIDACTPNRIDDLQSLTRQDDITKSAFVTYCPLCEGEFQERWFGPVISLSQLVGTWRNTKNGSTITIQSDGRCYGIGLNGKSFTTRWKILHRGSVQTRYGRDDYKFYHVITRITPDSFVDRWEDGGIDHFVRVARKV